MHPLIRFSATFLTTFFSVELLRMGSDINYRSYLIAIGLLLLAACSVGVALNHTEELFNAIALPIWKYALRSLLLFLGLALGCFGVYRLAKITHNKTTSNLLLSFASIYSLVLILEITLSFTAISSGGGDVLVSRNWFNFYWEENEEGYRDHDPTELDRKDKQNILIVGDSYVAGHGLEHEKDRFSNLLREQLSSCYDVFNLGICGANTVDQLQFLINYPVKPDLVILVHGKNDIQEVLPAADIQRILNIDPETVSDYPKRRWQSHYSIKNSFLINLAEFLLHRAAEKKYIKEISHHHSTLEDILSTEVGKLWYYSYYLNTELFETHLNMLDSITHWSDKNNAASLLVLFPAITDQILLDTDRIINQPIQQHAQKHHVNVINLTPILENLQESDRIVSVLDPHPSIELNQLVADTLSKQISEIMRKDTPCALSLE